MEKVNLKDLDLRELEEKSLQGILNDILEDIEGLDSGINLLATGEVGIEILHHLQP